MRLTPYIPAIILSLILTSCSYGVLTSEKRLIKNNVCLYNVDSMYRSVKEELDQYNLQPGHWIADIGFGQAWLEGIIALKYDSLTIYANEIDKYDYKTAKFNLSHYLLLRESPNTNTIRFIRGRKTATRLPPNSFDKVIIRETFHHFKKMDVMLQDISGILKPNGKVYLLEPYVETTQYSRICNTRHYCQDDVVDIMARNGFILVDTHMMQTYAWWDDRPGPTMMYIFTQNPHSLPFG